MNFVNCMQAPLQQPQPAPFVARPSDFAALGIERGRPLAIVDVDEVLGLFVAGFGRFLESAGLEFRLETFSLTRSIFRPGEAVHLDPAEGREHLHQFFRRGSFEMEPAPGAAKALAALSKRAQVVILSNAPRPARLARARWLGRHGLDYPLLLNEGPKGAAVAALAARSGGATAFVDDMLPNLDSVAEAAPAVQRFQHVADERLRPLAPTAPERHVRIDDWDELHAALEEALGA